MEPYRGVGGYWFGLDNFAASLSWNQRTIMPSISGLAFTISEPRPASSYNRNCAKFDPVTEKFTEYPLATLGSEARFLDVDDTTTPSFVWLPYTRGNKLGRVEFR